MEKKNNWSPWHFLILSFLSLLAGWLFIAPLLVVWFALLIRAYDSFKIKKEVPHKFSLAVLLYIFLGILSGKFIQSSISVITLVHSVILALAFIIYSYTDHFLSYRFNALNIVIFWLGLQYVSLKLFPSDGLFFLAAAPSIPSAWVSWNIKTGFLGVSFWVFVINLFVYKSFFSVGRTNWLFVIFTILIIIAPVLISLKLNYSPLTAQDMLNAYRQHKGPASYSEYGEWIARTAAWISVLVVIFTLVKLKTQKP